METYTYGGRLGASPGVFIGVMSQCSDLVGIRLEWGSLLNPNDAALENFGKSHVSGQQDECPGHKSMREAKRSLE